MDLNDNGNNGQLIILFGGTGDLAKRKLIPALFELFDSNILSNNSGIICVGRKKLSENQFYDLIRNSLDSHYECSKGTMTKELFSRFIHHFSYKSANLEDEEDCRKLTDVIGGLEGKFNIKGNRLFYLSIPPSLFKTAVKSLKKCNLLSLSGWNRIVVEKPFGYDTSSAKELNNELQNVFKDKDIYRIDHFLNKNIVNKVHEIRSMPQFDYYWNNNYIEKIYINLSESLGVDDRGEYFDSSGTLRDMVQNHILQIITILMMNRMSSNDPTTYKEAKVKLLKSMRAYSKEDIHHNIIRGQYLGGLVDGNFLSAYKNEKDVRKDSKTETFVAGKLFIDNQRWMGVPVFIQTGKRLKEKVTSIEISFKKEIYFTKYNHYFTKIRLSESPGQEGVVIDEDSLVYKTVPNNAYAVSLMEVLDGDKTNFVSWEEIIESWNFIDKIISAWETDYKMYYYSSGTDRFEKIDNQNIKNNHFMI